MKTWMKVVLGIIGVIALIIGFVFWLTSDIVKTGDDFFAAIEQDKKTEAYALLSPQFKSNASLSDFKTYLDGTGLSGAKSVSWTSRFISGNVGDLEGTMTTNSGATVPLTMKLVKSESGWSIYNIQVQPSGFSDGGAAMAMPSVSDQLRLIDGTTDVFSDSISAKDMSLLHGYISPMWQSQITPDGLEDIFGSLYPLADKVAELKDASPKFSRESTLDKDGVLVIHGFYDTETTRAVFRYKYIFEGLKWRPFGLRIELVR